MPMPKITVGADPEAFLLDTRAYELASAVGIIPGSKGEPETFKHLGKGYNFHRDNVMVEFGVPPTTDPDSFVNKITTVTGAFEEWLGAKDPRIQLYRNVDLCEFPDELLATREAQEFGCEPDNDAYEGGAQRKAPDGIMGNWRSAGGHIHIGSEEGFNCPEVVVALMCDAYIGVYGAGRNGRKDNGEDFLWYRKPGLYREKEYGIEYRTPSNGWLFSSQQQWHIANRARAVGRYCAKTPTKDIRKMLESVDWLYVRAKMMGQEVTKQQDRDHIETIKPIRAYGGE